MAQEIQATKGNRFLLFISKFQSKHWFVYLLVVRLSVVWYSLVLTYLGETLHLISVSTSGGKMLTILGWISTIIITGIIILGEASKKYSSSLQTEPFEIGGFALLNNLRSGIENVCKSKYGTLLSEIHAIKTEHADEPPIIISNPPKQLDEIAKEMAGCLRFLLREDGGKRWQTDDLYVSVAYQFPLEGDTWHWATEEHGLCLSDLLHLSNTDEERPKTMSTLEFILSDKRSVVFFNSKADAEKDGKYIADDFDERDSDGKLLGSIACYEGIIKKADITYIHFVLTVTTYSRPFATDPQSAENTKHNMKEFVVSDFFLRIQIELCLLYLEQLGAMQKKKMGSGEVAQPDIAPEAPLAESN